MKNQRLQELFKKTSVKTISMLMAAMLVVGGSTWLYDSSKQAVPELVTYVDTEEVVQIEEEEVPLAAPKVTTSTKTKKTTKKVKLKTAARKTYTKTGKTKKKTATKKQTSSSATTTTKTVTATKVTDKYKKGSNINTKVTTVKTTVTKTVVEKQTASATSTAAATSTSAGATTAVAGTVSVSQIAPNVDARVARAFTQLGFKININPSVSYSGLCDAKTRTITLRKADSSTAYHELGHFVAFAAGNVDTSAAFKAVYDSEKQYYTEYNKAYILSNSAEYFAESFKNYTMNPAALKASRPQTYAAIEAALARITDSQVSKILSVYGAVWNA